jgi:tRNA pseudouridine38-40 synthase
MNGVLLTVAYDGSGFVGWARQKSERSVEATLEQAIRAIDPDASPPRGTSRTDAGVHAEGQLAAFDTTRSIDARGWVLALNAKLPDDVAVRRARSIDVEYNPRFAAKTKRYRYRIFNDELRDPHVRRAWRVAHALDLDRMRREGARLVGTHDFAAFRASSDERLETTRTLARVAVEQDEKMVSIVVEGDAFLHNMVRIIAGTLVDVARGHLPEGTVERAFATKDRALLGPTAPPSGLTLEHIEIDLPQGAGDPWPP